MCTVYSNTETFSLIFTITAIGLIFADQFSLLAKSELIAMSLLMFKFGLPLLLGYIIFAGVSNRFLPFPRPAELSARPRWLLGIWMGLSMGTLTLIGSNLALQLELSALPGLLIPAVGIAAGALLLGVVGFLLYHAHIQHHTTPESDFVQADATAHPHDKEFDKTLAMDSVKESVLDKTIKIEMPAILDSHNLEMQDRYDRWTIDTEKLITDNEGYDDTELLEVAYATPAQNSIQETNVIESDQVNVGGAPNRDNTQLDVDQPEITELSTASVIALNEKAIDTVNKATNIARDAVNERTQLEKQLQDSHSKLNQQEATIVQLQDALNKEKARTDNQVIVMAKRLVLEESQLQSS